MKPPRWRKMTWAIIVFSAGMLVWLIVTVAVSGGGVSDADIAECSTDGSFRTVDECREFLETDWKVGLALLAGVFAIFWLIGVGFLSLIWFMTQPKREANPP